MFKAIKWIFLILFIPIHISAQRPDFDLSGHQLKFDYKKHPKEREIAYRYYLNERSKYLPGITKEQIGIDLFDIDGDGIDEIFVYVNGGEYCPRAGCPFALLKQVKEKNGKNYEIIRLGCRVSQNTLYEGDDPKILNSTTYGWHDILIGEKDPIITIWSWNKEFYQVKYADPIPKENEQ